MPQSQTLKGKLTIVLAFGTFDLLHPGHRHFLLAAAKLGKELIVVVARDKNVRKLKGHLPIQSEHARLRAVRSLPYVTRALLGQKELKHRYDLVRKLQPNIITLGYDQKPNIFSLRRTLNSLELTIAIVRLKAYQPRKFKSSLLRP